MSRTVSRDKCLRRFHSLAPMPVPESATRMRADRVPRSRTADCATAIRICPDGHEANAMPSWTVIWFAGRCAASLLPGGSHRSGQQVSGRRVASAGHGASIPLARSLRQSGGSVPPARHSERAEGVPAARHRPQSWLVKAWIRPRCQPGDPQHPDSPARLHQQHATTLICAQPGRQHTASRPAAHHHDVVSHINPRRPHRGPCPITRADQQYVGDLRPSHNARSARSPVCLNPHPHRRPERRIGSSAHPSTTDTKKRYQGCSAHRV